LLGDGKVISGEGTLITLLFPPSLLSTSPVSVTDIWGTSKVIPSQPPVAHTYNPRYSGDSDQEDHCLKPVWANSLQDPVLKNPSQK
jgi:hypothetical protein